MLYSEQMIWNRLDHDNTLDMIGRIKTASEAVLFTPTTSEAKTLRLPFLKTFILYRLTNFSSLPVFSMDFLSDGLNFLYLDGSDNAINILSQNNELILNKDNIVNYINFYYWNVRLVEGEIILLKNKAEAPNIDLYDYERRENIDIIPDNIDIEFMPENGNLAVTTIALYDSNPMEVKIIVNPNNGQVITIPLKTLTFDNDLKEASK